MFRQTRETVHFRGYATKSMYALVVGPSESGKSSICDYYCNHSPSQTGDRQAQSKQPRKFCLVRNVHKIMSLLNYRFILTLWDTSGKCQEIKDKHTDDDYHSYIEDYYHMCDVLIIVLDGRMKGSSEEDELITQFDNIMTKAINNGFEPGLKPVLIMINKVDQLSDERSLKKFHQHVNGDQFTSESSMSQRKETINANVWIKQVSAVNGTQVIPAIDTALFQAYLNLFGLHEYPVPPPSSSSNSTSSQFFSFW